MLHWIGLAFLRLAGIMLLAGLLGATLLRLAPGFAADEQQLNSSLSAQSIRAIRQARLADADVPRYYARFISSSLRGDLGISQSLHQPVRSLLRDRLPVTLQGVAVSLSLAWFLGLSLAILTQFFRSRLLVLTAEAVGGAFISTPAAVLALVFIVLRWPPQLAAALLIFPKLYRYCRNLLGESYALPHVLTACAKGAGPWRVLMCHVAPAAMPQLLALLGVSVSLALGVLLPVEVICDIAGIGQLAWQAAQGRDLPLLVSLTLVVTFLTVSATMISDFAGKALTRSAA